eukprot:TRINITY_DN30358_c0_g1_i1.p2 TRINITY_DN30358_c0_g1~~TRINITY_DN30358_c0_g1_i1.p2  ORF type:complete len:129 (+),score=14.96 TRINITY_DN30358_c0_g1_i1:106-492(+)
MMLVLQQIAPEILAVSTFIGICILCQVAFWCPIAQTINSRLRSSAQNDKKQETSHLKIQVLPQKQKVVLMPSGSLKYGKTCTSDTSLANSTPLLEGVSVYLAGYDTEEELDLGESNSSCGVSVDEAIV